VSAKQAKKLTHLYRHTGHIYITQYFYGIYIAITEQIGQKLSEGKAASRMRLRLEQWVTIFRSLYPLFPQYVPCPTLCRRNRILI
jgi:hypothetical protein